MLYYIFLLILNALFTHGANEITGRDVIYVKNGETVSFRWEFNFQKSEIFLWSLKKELNDGGTSQHPIAIFTQSNPAKPNPTNTNYFSRTSVTSLQNGNGFIIDISGIGIEDEGIYVSHVTFEKSFMATENKTRLVVVVAPVIERDQPSFKLNEGFNAKLKCAVIEGNPRPLLFQWFKLVDGKRVAKTDQVAAHSHYHYNISRANRDSRGDYICRVDNIRGGHDEYKKQLYVRYRPVILKPPYNRTVFELEGTDEFNCDAEGNAGITKYHWYKETPIAENEILPTDSSKYIFLENNRTRLKFVKPPRTLSTTYYCAAQNDLGLGQPKGAFLNVTYVPGEIDILPVLQDNTVNGNEGSNMTIKCSSDANPPAIFRWTKLERDYRGVEVERTLVQSSYSGELKLLHVTTNDTAEYKCSATNYPNDLDSNRAYQVDKKIKVQIRYGPLYTNISVNGINTTHIEVDQFSAVKFECTSHSNPPATFNIQKRPGKTQLNKNDKGILEFDRITVADEGTYDCFASNKIMGNVEMRNVTIVVAIKPEKVKPIPEDQETREGSTTEIICNAEGKPPPLIYWQRYGANISEDAVVKMLYNNRLFFDDPKTTVSGKLKFNGIRYTDDGSYSCIAHNSAGQFNLTTKMTVNYKPKINVFPKNFTQREGDNSQVHFTCGAHAYPKVITWKWFFNNVEQATTKSTFIRQFPKRKDNGIYRCVASNQIGEGESATAYLTVEYMPLMTDVPEDKTVNESATVTFRCAAQGVPKPVVSWTKESDSSFEEFSETLTIKNVQAKDKDVYSCRAKNVVGAISESAKLYVNHQPIITTTTPGETKVGVEPGTKAELRCIVSAYPIATIKWKDESGKYLDNGGIYTITSPQADWLTGESMLSLTMREEDLGKKFMCEAKNSYGADDQQFQILGRGKPEKPVKLEASDVISPSVPVTSNITLKWTPGFSGGFPVQFTLLFKEKTEGAFSKHYIGEIEGFEYVFSGRKTSTTYVFSMIAKNERGSSDEFTPYLEYTTKDPPPPVAKVTVAQDPSGTAIIVRWIILQRPDDQSRKRREVSSEWDFAEVRYRIYEEGTTWTTERILDIQNNGTYKIEDLDGDKEYQVQFFLFKQNGEFGLPVDAGRIFPRPGAGPDERTGLSKTDIIAIAVGCGGAVLLVLVVVLFICIYKRKDNKAKQYQTHYKNGRVDLPVSTTMKSSNYGGDVVRTSFVDEDDDPYAMDSSVLDDEKSPPPEYNENHLYTTYRDEPDEVTPSYTSFGRLPKQISGRSQGGKDGPTSKSMIQLGGSQSSSRATEIARNRQSVDNIDEYAERHEIDPLLRRSINDLDTSYQHRRGNNPRNSRTHLPPPEDAIPEPPAPLKNAPSDENNLNNRVPGAFGDRARFKQPKYGDPPAQTPPTYTGGRSSPPSSVASSKPYRSDNEYIDDTTDDYVGYLV